MHNGAHYATPADRRAVAGTIDGGRLFNGVLVDDQIIWLGNPPGRGIMGNASQGQAKEPKEEKHHEGGSSKGEGLGRLYRPGLKILREKSSCCKSCCKFLFVILAVIVVIVSLTVIAVAVSTAFATKIYSSDLSGRLVAMIVLAVTAAVTFSMTLYAIVAVFKRQPKALHAVSMKIYSSDLSGRLVAMIVLAVTAAVAFSMTLYAIVAVFKRQPKALHAASVVLVCLALIQAVIAGVSIKVTPEDEVQLSRSLTESFNLAHDDNPRHVKIWATTQHDLTCCGVYSAEDYRTPNLPPYFPPDVPISCCPSYVPDRSELVQERDREICKAKKEFYDLGCKDIVIDVFKETAAVVLSCTIALICLEIVLSIIGSRLSKEKHLLVVVSPEDGELGTTRKTNKEEKETKAKVETK